ncbi:hypothetical protein [Sneathiella limimaris]|uniref:capsular polysaccharide export protein, LipB/KpsS family n=1 Tax=Sneathiella limimaris TaxID=1964213 RepID=UPI00146EBBD4|nr:hypothetical protein [Sneathiella limimaris]
MSEHDAWEEKPRTKDQQSSFQRNRWFLGLRVANDRFQGSIRLNDSASLEDVPGELQKILDSYIQAFQQTYGSLNADARLCLTDINPDLWPAHKNGTLLATENGITLTHLAVKSFPLPLFKPSPIKPGWIYHLAKAGKVLSQADIVTLFCQLLDVPVYRLTKSGIEERHQWDRDKKIAILYDLFQKDGWQFPNQTSLKAQENLLYDVLAKSRFKRLLPPVLACLGFSKWKRGHIKKMLAPSKIRFFNDDAAALDWRNERDGEILVWSSKLPQFPGLASERTSVSIIHMEDGFIRSKGLGAHLVPAQSLVIDRSGIYYNPSQASDLERFLNTHEFSKFEKDRAAELLKTILEKKLNKYNLQDEPLKLPLSEKKTILVPGQVEDDASIITGTNVIQSNLKLLQKVREDFPKARILYKPHPDVEKAGREGAISVENAKEYADIILNTGSIDQLLPSIDQVCTMTSLLGFEALLRGISVTTYGGPFYAGWGLTDDRGGLDLSRRQRKLSIEQLIFGTLIHYPFYLDREFRIISAETFLTTEF